MQVTILFFTNFINVLALYLFSFLPLNYIWGSLGKFLTFSTGLLPLSISMFPISTFFYYLYYGFSIVKIPSLAGGLFMYFMNTIKSKTIKKFISVAFFIVSLCFFVILKSFGAVSYALMWIVIPWGIYINNRIGVIASSIFFAHCVGTFVYIFIGMGLSPNEYTMLIPIAIAERILLIVISFFMYYFFNYLPLLIGLIRNQINKKLNYKKN